MPEADSYSAAKGALFDDLIGGDQQARWNCQAKCLRRFAVDDSFELRRRLHRKVSGFCTAQDAVDIGCPLSRQIDEVSPVIHKTARCDENTERVNRGQAMPGCQRDNEITMDNGRGIWRQHQPAIRLTGEGFDGALDVGSAVEWRWNQVYRERWSHRFGRLQEVIETASFLDWRQGQRA